MLNGSMGVSKTLGHVSKTCAPATTYMSCPEGSHDYEYSKYCGAYVCYDCDHHKGLARCYCGWSESGGDGYRELREMGEQIEEDY